jgi:hypothetical protein
VNFQQGDNVKQYKTNVFAFWKEIDVVLRDYYDSVDPNKLIKNSEGSRNITDDLNKEKKRATRFHDLAIIADDNKKGRYGLQIFNDALLIDQRNINERNINLNQLYKNVSRLLEMISGTYGDQVRSHLDNTVLKFAADSFLTNKPWIKQFWSAGYAEIRGGSEYFKKYVIANIRLLVFQAFLGEGVSKNGISDYVKPIIQKSLLSRIERTTGVDGYQITAYEKDSSILNLHKSIDSFWTEKIQSNLESIFNEGVELKNDESADGMKKIFESDIKNVTLKLQNYIISGETNKKILPFSPDLVVDDILNDLFNEVSELAYSKGLFSLNYAIEDFDNRVDDFAMSYDSQLKSLSEKKTNIIIDDVEILNRNLIDSISLQYSKLKDGPSFLKSKKDWYQTELTILKNLIKSNFDYQAEELSLKLKKEICDKISQGKSNDMTARNRIQKLLNEIKNSIDNKDNGLKRKANQDIKEEYIKIKENAITCVIPDVTKFAELDETGDSTFNDSKKNIFKYIFENECGLALANIDGSTKFIREKSENSNIDKKTLEDLLNEIFREKKYLLPNLQKGTINENGFKLEFEKLIEEILIANLSTILPATKKDGPSYSQYSTMKLQEWIKKDPKSFEDIRESFINRSSIFCYLKNASVAKRLWLSDKQLIPRIDQLIQPNLSLEDAENNPQEKTHQITDEDAIILINHVDNLGFDNYKSFDNYLADYKINLTSSPNTFYPHIDVRFKMAMIKNNNINLPENHKPMMDVLESISKATKTITATSNSNSVKDSIEHFSANYLGNYFKAYFLLKFYEKINTSEYQTIYYNLVRYRDFQNSSPCIEVGNEKLSPIYLNGIFLVILYCEKIKSNETNSKIYFDADSINLQIELYNTNNFENLVMDLNALETFNMPQQWEIITKTNASDAINFNLSNLLKNYSKADATSKNIYKSVINDVKQIVLTELRSQIPQDADIKQFYLKPFSEFNKFINSII